MMLCQDIAGPLEFPLVIRDGPSPCARAGDREPAPEAARTTKLARRGREPSYHPTAAVGMIQAGRDLQWIGAYGELAPAAEYWPALAPLVEQLWNHHAAGPRPPGVPALPGVPLEVVERTLAIAEAAQVRSFAQGIEAASDYLFRGN